MRFHTPLQLEQIGNRRWRLLSDLRWESTEDIPGVYVVPAGFTTDLASIPRLAWLVFPPTGQYDRAAVLHDAGCRGVLQTREGRRIRLIKTLVDDLFLSAMRADGVGRLTAWLMYRAVSTFGAMPAAGFDGKSDL